MKKACVRGRKFSCGVRWEKGKTHKPVGAGRERGGTMGSHQEESPNSCATTSPRTNVHPRTHTCNLSALLSVSVSHTVTQVSWSCTLWSRHLKGGQLSRCSATVFTKAWVKRKDRRETNLLPLPWVSMQHNRSAYFVLIQIPNCKLDAIALFKQILQWLY